MKILHLIYTNGIAGAEKYLRHLLPPLKDHGIECHLILVCAPGYESPLQQYCIDSIASGIPAQLIVSSKRGFITTARKIGKYLEQNDISYIHSHLLKSDVLATLVKIFAGRKITIISTKHGYKESVLKQIPDASNMQMLRKKSKMDLYFYVTRFVIKYAAHNYAVSKAISSLYNSLGLTKTEMPFIHHGITIRRPNPGIDDQFRRSDKQLVIVGRLEEFKGHRYLIEAMPKVIAAFPDAKLLIIGEGSQESNLKHLCSVSGITSSIHFMGFINDPYSYVDHSDIVILPSLFEPFGLVFIEAFALRTPVIAFDTPAGNEIMDHNTAILVAARNSDALANQIISLLGNKKQALEMAERAYQKYQEFYTTSTMVHNTAVFYKEVERTNGS